MALKEISARSKDDLACVGEVACAALSVHKKLTAQVSLKLLDGPTHAGRRDTQSPCRSPAMSFLCEEYKALHQS